MENALQRLESLSKLVLYAIAAAIPLWFVPLPIGVEFGREITFGILIIAALILKLLSTLTGGENRFQYSYILYSALALLAVAALSASLSKAPLISFYLADTSAEKFSILALGVILMMLVGSVFASRQEVGTFLMVLIFSSGISALVTVIQLLLGINIYGFLSSFIQGVDFNVVGTINGYALYLAVVLVMAAGLSASSSFSEWKPWARYSLLASMAVFALGLLLINFSTAWLILLLSSIFFFGLVFKNARMEQDYEGNFRKTVFGWNYALAAGLLALSVAFLVIRAPLIKDVPLPAEVSPTLRSTMNVGKAVYGESFKNMLIGTGPGTFGYEWIRHKDRAINDTIFWGVRFNQGFSMVSTVFVTAGILGGVTLLAFLAFALGVLLKTVLVSSREEDNISTSLYLGLIALVAAMFLYPANLTLVLAAFILIGLLSLIAAKTATEANGYIHEGERRGLWSRLCAVHDRSLRFENEWGMFFSSLVIVFLLAASVAGLYMEGARLRSAHATYKGIEALNAGDVDRAISHFESASLTENKNFRTHLTLLQARTEKVRRLIEQATQGVDVQEQFLAVVSQATQDGQRALSLNPAEPAISRALGTLYETMIPYIDGSERFAFENYRRASELDPLNPTVWVDWARAGLVYTDRIQLLMGQISAQEREEAEIIRQEALAEVAQVLEKAIEAKGDFAPAHFLLSQTAIRQGNLQLAIQSTENSKRTAPFDIGVAFQLGLLYYQADNITLAEQEFARAVSLNTNYSNARYFLGLIYDRRGERERAIAEFEQIESLNPDNDEVKLILSNLRQGRSALADIVPPAEPPERRVEPPVSEQGS